MTTETPALDYLRRVQTRQEDEGNRTAGLIVVLPEREQLAMDEILARAGQGGAAPSFLESQARRWLIGYRELEQDQRILTGKQRDELDLVLAGSVMHAPRDPLLHGPFMTVLAIAFIIGILIAGGLKLASMSSHPAAPPPPAAVAPAQAPQPVPAQLTPLQQFERDWNVPASAQADAGQHPKRLIVLMNGLYYPTDWTVPATDPAWQPDTGGHVTPPAQVIGGNVTFTDANGTSWTVAAGQPFVLSSDPGTVLAIDIGGHIWSMPSSHAVVIRHRAK